MTETLTLKASAVQFTLANVGDNPNRMPFKGVLTYFDAPSDKPPGGSGGRKVLIPSSVGISALDSLKGMGVNLAADADDHEVTHKIGVITDAYTGQLTAKGLEVIVEGHIFARDFPHEASTVKLNQSSLGFSYETANTLLASEEINGEEVAVAKSLVFTGAAILYKKAAAYQNTSIAASANKREDNIEVNAEELKALFDGFKTDLLASVDAKLEAAAKMKKMADDTEEEDEADSVQQEQAANPKKGVKPVPKPENAANVKGDIKASVDVESIVKSAVEAALAAVKPVEVQASATTVVPPAPERRSFPSTSLMAKYGVDESATNLTAAIDTVAKSGLSTAESLAMKLEGIKNGLIKY